MLHKFRKYIYPRNTIINLIPNNSKVLDLGCGKQSIYEVIKIKKNLIQYRGVDPILKFKSINNNFELLPLNIEDVLTDIPNFDCILLIDVLHHIKKNDQKSLIEEIISQLKSGSTLIYKDISNRNFFYSFMNRLHDFFYNGELINYYETDQIIDFAKQNKKIFIKRFFHRIFWYDHEFLVIKKKY